VKLKIGARLMATFAIILAFLIIICAVATLQMGGMNATTQAIVGLRAEELRLTNRISDGTFRANALAYEALEAPTPEAQIATVEQAEDVVNDNTALYAAMSKLVNTETGRVIFGRVSDAHAAYEAAMSPVYAQLRTHDSVNARAALLRAAPVRDALVKQQREFLDYVQGLMDASGKETSDAYTAAREVLWITALIAVIVACVLAAMVTRSIVQPLRQVVDGANALARGDLSVHLDQSRQDEVGVLAAALDTAIAQLGQIVSGVKQASQSISSATHQLAAGNTDLSQRTEEQAASLQETASSMEQLTATVRQNADNAREASDLSNAASHIAHRGGEEVDRVVQTMRQISDSSVRVAEIVSVIEGIAFQTNILALNAAVEAARVGEEGRGFAVVAGEVRSLAQRSATAAREIAELIGESVTRVKAGEELVADAGGTIREIVHSVMRVTEIMNEISAASFEQSTGIEQVNQAVSQMDQVTQQNAALVEEAAAAAQSMAQQAQSLVESVAIFKLDATQAAAVPL
jgi:methyl-accepting chemotaxis protein